MIRSLDLEDVIKDFALTESRKRTYWIVYCIVVASVCSRDVNETLACESDACIQNDVRAILQWSKKLRILACKRDPMIRDRDETETFDFSVRDEIETETFPRFHETETFGNYVSRPRRRDRDYISSSGAVVSPVKICATYSQKLSSQISREIKPKENQLTRVSLKNGH